MTSTGRALVTRLGLLVVLVLLGTAVQAVAHEAPVHADPELLVGWRTWLHLTIQWIHLLGLAFWFSLTAAPLFLRLTPPLSHLLYSSWALFLVLLATGDYNMEHGAGIPMTPSLLYLPLMGQIPYAVPYTVTLAVKLGLFFLLVLFAGAITLLHARNRFTEAALRSAFLFTGSALGILIALVASVLLLFHEAADLWPTALHSIGGVLGPEGPRGVTIASSHTPPPNNFGLLGSPQVWGDIGVRWLHLLGFGLWVGGTTAALCFGGVTPGRFLVYTWAALGIQTLSGVASMASWTPFYLPPYIWNLNALSPLRFGRAYTILLAVKHAVVLTTLILTGGTTLRYWNARGRGKSDAFSLRPFLLVSLFLGLAIAYVMIVVLLVHEGVDHVL
ncbi:MAG: hypothetical protein ACREJ6_13685 [Candidatus Methylomirabilis sp.]